MARDDGSKIWSEVLTRLTDEDSLTAEQIEAANVHAARRTLWRMERLGWLDREGRREDLRYVPAEQYHAHFGNDE